MTDVARHETQARGTLGVVAAVAAWGFGPIFVKLIEMPGLTLALYRLWLGFAVMVIVMACAGRRMTWLDLKTSGACGALFGVNVSFFFTALKHTSVADASLITALAPVLILVVAGPLLGERLRARDIGLTAVVIAGVALVVLGSSGQPEWSLLGDGLAVGALVSWAAYFVATKRARATMATLEYQTGVLFGAALVATPVALLSGSPLVAPHGDDWIWLLAFVLLPGAIGHLLMSWSHRFVDVSVSSLIVVAQPVVSALAATVVLHERLGALQLAGGAVVLAAIASVVRDHRRLEADLVAAD
ncbi:MAG TPA: DMT family transporter [Acidimicrobiales bacterium]|nr:DMT family transporter [Acidimicrobiales bacterium]